ncbi:MAG: hypothetical protein WC624_04825, partial [Candidatus Margulisiibacteriota bacterium]
LIYADKISLTNSSVLNGSAAVEQVGYFSNSVKLTYDPSKFPSFLPQGLGDSGASTPGLAIIQWAENF